MAGNAGLYSIKKTIREMNNLVGIVITLVIYFIPTICASEKKNFASIFALNVLLGWTIIGWIVALVWGLSKD